MVVAERGLTNLRVRFTDESLDAKYVFPFWDREWRVKFLLLDLLGHPAEVLASPVERATVTEIETKAPRSASGPLVEETAQRFVGLHHLDPAWVLRGMPGPSESLRLAILRTNLAGKAKAGTEKVHDAEFDERLEGLVWLVTKDRSFVTRRYGPGKILFGDLK